MRVRATILATALLLCVITPNRNISGSRTPVRRALIIGINVYAPSQVVPADKPILIAHRSWSDLSGCVNDAEAMAAILVSRFGFDSENVKVLKDAKATREAILSEFRNHLIDSAQPDDVSVFFFAGHGSQVKNSGSNEPDKKDESFVPADAAYGAGDIRDKELSRLANSALDKGIRLTLIFDSCHSGSIARGYPRKEKARYMDPPAYSVKDSAPVENSPEKRGAVILSAAQDFQTAADAEDESGVPHGAFTAALLKALRTSSPSESVRTIFSRLRSFLHAGFTQEPVLAGNPEVLSQAFFHDPTDPEQLAVRAVVRKIRTDEIEMEGGAAVGLNKNSELIRTANGDRQRIEIVALDGLNRSFAKMLEGSIDKIQPGDIFTLSHWAPPEKSELKVWIPSSQFSESKLLEFAARFRVPKLNKNIQWIHDPTSDSPTHVIWWNGAEWILTDSLRNVRLGMNPDVSSFTQLVSQNTPPTRLFISLPPSTEFRKQIRLGPNTENDSVEIVSDIENATYILAGRMADSAIEYSWIFPNAGTRSGFPIRSDWVKNSPEKITELALRLAKLKAWLTLDSPPSTFPYTLALKHVRTGNVITTGKIREEDTFRFVLVGDPVLRKQPVSPRYLYLLLLNNTGKSMLIYPTDVMGNVENRVPFGTSVSEWPGQIELPGIFQVRAPLGFEHYVLLTSDEPIGDPRLLAFDGVRTRAAAGKTPLEKLLFGVGAAKRGEAQATPINWSIQRITIETVPKTERQLFLTEDNEGNKD